MPPPSKRKQSASTAATAAGETHRAAARRRTDQQLAEHESEDASLADVALDELSATGTATSAAPSSSAAAQAKSMFYDVGIDDVVLGISNDPVGLVGCTVVLTFVFCAARMVTPD